MTRPAHPLVTRDLEIYLRRKCVLMSLYAFFEIRVSKSMLKTVSECIALGYARATQIGGGDC